MNILYLTIISYTVENTWVQLGATRKYLRNTPLCLCVRQASTENLLSLIMKCQTTHVLLMWNMLCAFPFLAVQTVCIYKLKSS